MKRGGSRPRTTHAPTTTGLNLPGTGGSARASQSADQSRWSSSLRHINLAGQWTSRPPRGGYRPLMTTTPDEPDHTEPEEQDDVPGVPDEPILEPSDAGMPSDPNLDDDNTVVTPPNADPEPGAAAG